LSTLTDIVATIAVFMAVAISLSLKVKTNYKHINGRGKKMKKTTMIKLLVARDVNFAKSWNKTKLTK